MKMKNILILVICIIAFGNAQGQSNPAEVLANRIAQKMKDTLQLSESQRSQIYDLNMQMHNQKMQLRQQFAGDSTLRDRIQAVENTRDSLYSPVLTEQQFLAYKQKKVVLLRE
jgi:hypothetical protein